MLICRKEVGADVLLQLRGVRPHRARDQPGGGGDADAEQLLMVKTKRPQFL